MKGALFKDQILSDRERKNLDILEVIRRYGPVTRTEISRITKYNIVTVSNYVNNYIKKDLVVEKGLDISSGGRKPTLVELNSRNCFVIGIDIGPESIIAVLTDLSLNMITKVRKPRPKEAMEEVVSKSIELIYDVIEKSQIEAKKIRGLGIGISGIIDAKAGTVRDTDPLRGKTAASYISIKNLIEREFGIPTFVGNDATVAAFGEKRIGLDAEIENVLYMFSDVGCGIIIKGEIYAGAGGSAGEVQLNLNNEADEFTKELGFFRPGSVNLGIVDAAATAIKEGKDTKIKELADGKPENINADMVIEAARQNDPLAMQILEKAGLNLGIRIAYLINLFNPEIVILGGGMEKAGDLIIEPIKRMVRRLAFEEPASMVRIIPSRLGENSVSLGAASLVIREIFIHA
ncbi:MAG: ROK family protein [Candidatus Omnitrophica bacterium]|nr:ROK family protein [Candidatus Omnitrophota bacterium]MBU4479152.1 ROK family protein [Candidatus Omnitrophota bacterium]MCG2702791.1 ROK family protein [Candidatus Omnitrophota bacterium]